jgi:integrase
MCAFGVEEAKVLTRNPATPKMRPKAPDSEVKSLSAEGARKLLAKARLGSKRPSRWGSVPCAAARRSGSSGAMSNTAATLLLAGGVDVKSAQAILGHAKASHTLDLYADSVPGNVAAAMRQLGSLL